MMNFSLPLCSHLAETLLAPKACTGQLLLPEGQGVSCIGVLNQQGQQVASFQETLSFLLVWDCPRCLSIPGCLGSTFRSWVKSPFPCRARCTGCKDICLSCGHAAGCMSAVQSFLLKKYEHVAYAMCTAGRGVKTAGCTPNDSIACLLQSILVLIHLRTSNILFRHH